MSEEKDKKEEVTTQKIDSKPEIKYDWYQTEDHVVITILAKNTIQDSVKVDYDEMSVSVSAKLPSGSDYCLELDLLNAIIPTQCSHRVVPSKIEIKLKKWEGLRWRTLESDSESTFLGKPVPQASRAEGPPKYPSSALKAKDWDRVAGDIAREEGDDKPEGEAALNALFEKIYSQGTDEVKRAMNKSFQESGGTVLSTSWDQVGAEKVDIKAPDGMEWRKWE